MTANEKIKGFFRRAQEVAISILGLGYLKQQVSTLAWENASLKEQLKRFELNTQKDYRALYEQLAVFRKCLDMPARVVFLCEQPSLWNSFHTVIKAMQEEPSIEVFLVRMWCKEYVNDGSFRYKAEDFSKISEMISQDFVESYDPESGKWLNLMQLQPDYVFYMRPYDYYRYEDYHIPVVSKYAKTCYIPYGMTIMGGEIEEFASPDIFCKYLYYYFLDTPLRKPFVKNSYGRESILSEERVLCLGYPRIDVMRQINETNEVRKKGNASFAILWLPRWNTSENCCHFFDYKDKLARYSIENERCNLILRPHPMCFQNFLNTGEWTCDDLHELKCLYAQEPALELDISGDYTKSFIESDVLVADETSLIAEYYVSGKPIILCKKETHFSKLMTALSEGIYIANNWEDLEATLSLLRSGVDPLKEKREEICRRELLQMDETAGVLIKERVLQDYRN